MNRKDEDIVFLRSMLASLSEKVEHMEKKNKGKMGTCNIWPEKIVTRSCDCHVMMSSCGCMMTHTATTKATHCNKK